MWSEVIVRYFHFLGILILAGCLMAQLILLKKEISNRDYQALKKLNLFYGIALISTLLLGLTLWIGVGKPKVFYTQNPVMHIKLTLFCVMVLLSTRTTIWFFKNKKGTDVVTVPKSILVLKKFEFLLLTLIPFTASILARGIGLPS